MDRVDTADLWAVTAADMVDLWAVTVADMVVLWVDMEEEDLPCLPEDLTGLAVTDTEDACRVA